jgi:xylulokinase
VNGHGTIGDLVAGVDVGTSNLKVGLYDMDGRCAASSSRPTPSTVEDLVAAALRGLHECAAETSRSPVAVGVAGMAETGAALDRDGAALTPLIPWTDSRGAAEVLELDRQCGAAALYRTTGRCASAKSPLAKWLWLRHHRPEVLDAMACWAGAPDLVVWALTGRASTHPTLAARTVAYDVNRRDYDQDLLALAGLRSGQLAPVTGFAGCAGPVTAAAAEAGGLGAGIPVVNAGHDHAVGAWAAGVRDVGAACVSLGTAEAVVLPTRGSPTPEPAMAHGFTLDPSVDGRHTCLVGGLPTSGALIEQLLDELPASEVAGQDRHARLRALLDSAGPLPTGIIVRPYPRGRAAPAPDPDVRLTRHGVTERHGAGDLLAAAIEGTCLHTRWMLDEAARIAGVDVQWLAFMGGQTRVRQWMRIKTALAPAPVALTRSPDAVCAGAALRAAESTGLVSRAPELPSAAATAEPPLVAAYQDIYRQFVRSETAVDDEKIGQQR